jgi:hypothetical protein
MTTAEQKHHKKEHGAKETFVKIEKAGEKIFDTAKNLVEKDIEGKLQDFATSSFVEHFEKMWWMHEIVQSPCLTSLLKKIGGTTERFFKIVGIIFLVWWIWSVFSIFGHWHAFLPAASTFLIGGIVAVQWLGLFFTKKRTAAVGITSVLATIVLGIVTLLMYQTSLFGAVGNRLWIAFIQFLVVVSVLKQKGLFVK